jgi:hypothetical protein
MTFANPSYLWALTGVAIPLGIHLLSRKEGKVIRVGSIRHVEESNTSQFKSVRLNEILLLLLRMLLITLLALFMSGAQCSGPASTKKVAYVERGINADSLKGYEVRELPEGSYWSFVEDLNRSQSETVVISYSKIENFTGQRVSLNDNIRWITAEPSSKEYEALAWRTGDSVFVRNARSDQQVTSFSTSMKMPDSIRIIEPHTVSIKTDNEIVMAALDVLKKEYRLPIESGEDQSVSVVQRTGPLVERISRTEIQINKQLDQDIALSENLVIELFKVLYPELQKPEVKADERILPDEFMWPGNKVAAISSAGLNAGIEKYLIALFILSLAIERFVAIRRNQ